jgi:hypothetical protein
MNNCIFQLIIELNVQECDTRDDAIITNAGTQNIILNFAVITNIILILHF